MTVELATAYISLVPSTRGFTKETEKQIAPPMEKSGKTLGDSILSGIGNSLKVGAVAVGAAAVGGLGTALVKGFQRLDALDQATAKLNGLGHSTETVQTIMDNALASVRGTAFGMDEAATAAANAVASGIKPGADLERTLKAIADAATIAGVDMGSMGAIFNKVAASNKVQMDVINQLHDAGVPALALLADQMGVTAEEASKMASRGEIDFATFQEAMEAGMGGAALESGNTFSGAMDNVMAALGRVGANLLGGIFPQLTDGFKGVIEWLGPFEAGAKDVGRAIGDFVADVGPKFIDALQTIWSVGQNVVSFIKDNLTWIGPLAVAIGAAAAAWATMSTAISIWRNITLAATAVQAAFNLVLNANPIMLAVTAIAALVAGLVWFFTQTELGQQIWENVTNAIGAAVTWLWESVIKPVIDFIGAAWDWLYNTIILPIVTGIMLYIGLWAAAITWLWENAFAPVFDLIGAVFGWIWDVVIKPIVDLIVGYIKMWGAILTWLYENAIKPAFDAVAAAFDWVWKNGIKPVIDAITGAIEWVGSTIEDVFGGISDFIGSAFQSVLSVVRGPINALIDLINGIINGLNSISVTIPDWVPLVGGQTFGLNIPTIPRLARGAVVRATPGGSIVNVGEGRWDEAVVPLGGPQLDRLADAVAERSGGFRPGDRVVFEIEGQPLTAVAKRVVGGAFPSAGAVRSELPF